MAFKMKGFPMQAGTSGVKHDIHLAKHSGEGPDDTTIEGFAYKSPMKQTNPNIKTIGNWTLDISTPEGRKMWELFKQKPTRSTTFNPAKIAKANRTRIANTLKTTKNIGGNTLKNLLRVAGGPLLLLQLMLTPTEAGASETEYLEEVERKRTENILTSEKDKTGCGCPGDDDYVEGMETCDNCPPKTVEFDKPLVDYPLPEGYEIVDGEMVKKSKTIIE